MRRGFDPRRYRAVLFDQRGCGRSVPHASDPATDLSRNTTEHLITDMEQLREQLAIDRWLLTGGSWGSTLMLAYAERYPHRVTQIVISAVTTSRRSEIDWLYRGAARFFPGEWERFRAGASAEPGDGDLLAAYARLLADPDPLIRNRAAADWRDWEDAVLSLEPGARPDSAIGGPDADTLAFARLCAHYYSHGAWLEEGALIRGAGRLAGIPGVLIHGRLDLSCPLDTAWELARAWPDASCTPRPTPGTGAATPSAGSCSARSTSSPGSKRASTSLAARTPERSAPSISPAQSPAVCSPAKWTRPAGAAMTSSSPGATLVVSAVYDSPAHGSSFQVVSSARPRSSASSGRSAATWLAHAAGPSRDGQCGQARLGSAEGVDHRLHQA